MERSPPFGAEPDHWPLSSESLISKTSVPPFGPGTAPEELFERKKRTDEALDAHIATDTVSCADDGRPRRDVEEEKELIELSSRTCWAWTRARRDKKKNMIVTSKETKAMKT